MTQRELINLQTRRVKAEIHFLSARVANAIDQLDAIKASLIALGVDLEELHGSLGESKEPM